MEIALWLCSSNIRPDSLLKSALARARSIILSNLLRDLLNLNFLKFAFIRFMSYVC